MGTKRRKLPMEDQIKIQMYLIESREKFRGGISFPKLEKLVFDSIPDVRGRLSPVTLKKIAKAIGIPVTYSKTPRGFDTGMARQIRLMAEILLDHLGLEKKGCHEQLEILHAIKNGKFFEYVQDHAAEPSEEKYEQFPQTVGDDSKNGIPSNEQVESIRGVMY